MSGGTIPFRGKRKTTEPEGPKEREWKLEGDWLALSNGDHLLLDEIAAILPHGHQSQWGAGVLFVLRSGAQVMLPLQSEQEANAEAGVIAQAIADDRRAWRQEQEDKKTKASSKAVEKVSEMMSEFFGRMPEPYGPPRGQS